ncbi:winged helix DNA-binding protein [Frondihabitans sp. PhB188]|uniref:winged helix DNA-binding domain-containing protein n=1 Tax=Frondihabitans sp. PhB188 TaxID=2485200 RepID=UPI000F48C3B0|nr:winged helix DNA-binding domain-containing protein [Frondihabitans sp. PhB188]ROQ41528.1 winged helix DNA-binding protein [Frondihabitans sp. PhB188]
MRTFTAADRRALLVRRHHLTGDAATPEQATRSVLALHATDPASVYLQVLARARDLTIADVQAAMYDRRALVRWMAMRRTLFVFPREIVPVVQAAASTPLAVTLRRRLVRMLELNGTEPSIAGDIGAWVSEVERGAHAGLLARGTATGAQLSTDEPRLRTAIVPRVKSDLAQNVTSILLTLMSAEGSIVRGTAAGEWTTRLHRWEPLEHWWPDGLPVVEQAEAQASLVEEWLRVFGPAPVSDIEWWTGWTKTAVRAALGRLAIDEVDLDGEPGVALAGAELDVEPAPPAITLLPALDPTPMGYKQRGWFFGVDPAPHFDTNGNLGPTVWWGGEIVGGWAVAADGEVRVKVVADRGTDVPALAAAAGASLQERLGGALVKPVFRTPFERALTA